MSSTPGCSTAASPGRRRSRIRRSATGRSGRCSRRSGRAWCASSRPLRRLPCHAGLAVEDLLVRFDNNKDSVMASAVGRPLEVRAYAERIELRQDGRIVGQHRRVFGRGQTVYDPWHYVPVLARKPGALRNGAPFQDWVLPGALERVRRKLRSVQDGDRQMVGKPPGDGRGSGGVCRFAGGPVPREGGRRSVRLVCRRCGRAHWRARPGGRAR
jgi:hypothetical protein